MPYTKTKCADCEKLIPAKQMKKREAKKIPIRSPWLSFPKSVYLCKSCAAKDEPQINTTMFN